MNIESIDNSDPFSPSAQPDAKILILDDEPSIGDLLGEILDLFGYASTRCTLPESALSLLIQESFDVVLSDYRMPQMNGQQFYHAAVRIRPELARRIVFLTGDSVNEETQSFLRSTGNPHLPKPFQAAKVAQVISEVLKQPLLAAA